MTKIITFTNALSAPCNLLKTELQALVDENIIVWQNYDMTQDKDFILSYDFMIRSFPTIVFYDGEEIKLVVNGFIPRDRILELYGFEEADDVQN